MKRFAIAALLVVSILVGKVHALDPNRPGVFVRVVDVGAGLGCVVKVNNADGTSSYMLFDTGNSRNKTGYRMSGRYGTVAFAEIKKLIPETSPIDWVVISHTDLDHLGATAQVCDRYTVKNFLRTGWERENPDNRLYAYRQMLLAIPEEVADEGAVDHNQSDPNGRMELGHEFDLGDAKLTLLSGFAEPPADWGSLSRSKARNSISIVLRLDYKGKSILFTGDALGAKDGAADGEVAIATEKFLLANNNGNRTIDSDVLMPAHHGANNGCSRAFLAATSPRFVIFSAGASHGHPRKKTAERIKRTPSVRYMFRRDHGDRRRSGEWRWESTAQGGDGPGDDHVDIAIAPRVGCWFITRIDCSAAMR